MKKLILEVMYSLIFIAVVFSTGINFIKFEANATPESGEFSQSVTPKKKPLDPDGKYGLEVLERRIYEKKQRGEDVTDLWKEYKSLRAKAKEEFLQQRIAEDNNK